MSKLDEQVEEALQRLVRHMDWLNTPPQRQTEYPDDASAREEVADLIKSLIKEARIDELNKLWADDTIHWVESGSSADWDKSITLSDRLAELKGDKDD